MPTYLWARQHDYGEESGRKTRPTCVMLIVTGTDGVSKPLPFSNHQPASTILGAVCRGSRNRGSPRDALNSRLGHRRRIQ